MPAGIELRELTAQEYAAYRVYIRDEFYRDLVEQAGRDPEEASVKADTTFEQLPATGCPSGQVIRVAERAGVRVGLVWVGPAAIPGLAWLNDIEVEPAVRGQGVGRALMVEAERIATELGFQKLGLNVTGGNTAAIGLYRASGYTVMHQQMVRTLG